MATSDNALLGISDSETYTRWTDSEFCIFTRPFRQRHSLCARRNVGSPSIRVAVTCEHVQGRHWIFSHSGTQIVKFSRGSMPPNTPIIKMLKAGRLRSPWRIRLKCGKVFFRTRSAQTYWRHVEIPTATREPSEIATYDALKFRRGTWTTPLTGPALARKKIIVFSSATSLSQWRTCSPTSDPRAIRRNMKLFAFNLLHKRYPPPPTPNTHTHTHTNTHTHHPSPPAPRDNTLVFVLQIAPDRPQSVGESGTKNLDPARSTINAELVSFSGRL